MKNSITNVLGMNKLLNIIKISTACIESEGCLKID